MSGEVDKQEKSGGTTTSSAAKDREIARLKAENETLRQKTPTAIAFGYEQACEYLKDLGCTQNNDVWTTPNGDDIRVPDNINNYAYVITNPLNLLGKEHYKVIYAFYVLAPEVFKEAIAHPFCNK